MATMFGLRHNVSGKLLGFSTCAGGEEFCVDVEVELEVTSDNVWLVPRREIAEQASVQNPDWYARGYETPGNPYVGEVSVVEVTLTGIKSKIF